ncbi:hypothetical protein TNCT_501041 [Trichonephila clavata]|uniref:Uncharacterized protein n=1 Tax=Trichonephila clavata TaxID=2740835 RepID=A0A8X6LYH7_TRICU|nr:hypothetical protein TNCT_501041 [Trichonephila clavata]
MSRRLKDDYIEDLLAQIENGDIYEDEQDLGDLNEIDYPPDLQDLIDEKVDNNDDEEENENPPSTMEKESLDHFNNLTSGPSNCQPHPSFICVAAWRHRSIWKKT